MKFTIIAAAVSLAALTSSAYASDDRAYGSFSGTAKSFSATGGHSFQGNGNGFSEAGQFAGSKATLTFDGRQGMNVHGLDGFTGTAQTETFSEGFQKSRGNSFAKRNGFGKAHSTFNGWGSDSW